MKRLLEKFFNENIDYKIICLKKGVSSDRGKTPIVCDQTKNFHNDKRDEQNLLRLLAEQIKEEQDDYNKEIFLLLSKILCKE